MAEDSLAALVDRTDKGQTLMTYYLITICGSAIVLLLGRIEQARVDLGFGVLLLPSLACWVIAFFRGFDHFKHRFSAARASVDASTLVSETHTVMAGQTVPATFAHGILTDIAEKLAARAGSAIVWQTRLMGVGAALYFAWLMFEKLAHR